MVAQRQDKPTNGEIMARAQLIGALLDVIDGVTKASNEINVGSYWEAYRTVTEAELKLSEIALGLHDLDVRYDGGAT
jgi:hypothetical protein